jgi:signal transduction histidine kinase
MAAQREVRLERGGPPSMPLRCDPRKVRQVLVNLVQNALEASAPRSTIRITLHAGEDEARIDVDDEGSGLGAVELARAFDVGFTTKTTGSGLGLALARGLVRQHGGELTLSRREPRGCRASFTLSRSLAALDTTERPPRASETLAEAT